MLCRLTIAEGTRCSTLTSAPGAETWSISIAPWCSWTPVCSLIPSMPCGASAAAVNGPTSAPRNASGTIIAAVMRRATASRSCRTSIRLGTGEPGRKKRGASDSGQQIATVTLRRIKPGKGGTQLCQVLDHQKIGQSTTWRSLCSRGRPMSQQSRGASPPQSVISTPASGLDEPADTPADYPRWSLLPFQQIDPQSLSADQSGEPPSILPYEPVPLESWPLVLLGRKP